jgi:HEAT repeat protein
MAVAFIVENDMPAHITHGEQNEKENTIFVKGHPVSHWLRRLASVRVDTRLKAIWTLSEAAKKRPKELASIVPSLARAVADRDGRMRMEAVKALAHFRVLATKAAPALERALQDEDDDIRFETACSLALVGDLEAALPVVLPFLEDVGKDVVRTLDVHLMLSKVGPAAKMTVPQLSKNLERGPWQVCETAAQALRQILGAHAVPLFVKAMKHKDPVIRRASAEALGELGRDGAKGVDELIHLLSDNKAGIVREAAAEAIGKSVPGSEPARRALTKAFNDRSTLVKTKAAVSLATLDRNNKRALEMIRMVWKAKDWRVRFVVVSGASRFVDPTMKEMVPLLIRSLSDREEMYNGYESGIPRWAAIALGMMRSVAVDPLISVLENNDLESHFWALDALAAIGPAARKCIPSMCAILDRMDIYERAAQAKGSGHLTLRAVRGCAIRALSQVINREDKATVKYFIQVLDAGPGEWNTEVILSVIQGLAKLGPYTSEAVTSLKKLTQETDDEVRETAIEALRKQGVVVQRPMRTRVQ